MVELNDLTENQREAASRKNRPSFIMAGAGTGKTYTVAKKIAFMMGDEDRPLAPEKLMAITFTEAAAAELLDRSMRRAIEAGVERADRLEAACISTIHAMCHMLVVDNAFDAGEDPGCVVISEAESEAMFSAAVDQALAECSELEQLVDAAGSYVRLRELVLNVLSIAARTPGGVASLDFGPCGESVPENARRFSEALDQGISDYESVLATKKGKTAETMLSDVESMRRATRLWQDGDVAGACSISLASRVGDVKEVKEAVVAAACFLKADSEAILVNDVREVALQAEVLIKSALSVTASLTFDSLLEKAADMFSDPVSAASIASRYDAVMIDEFQDTDALQSRIAEGLCSDESGLAKLTVVGDRQQSIYRFRGAEVSVSDDMLDAMCREDAQGDPAIPLDVNFRSVPQILSFVADAFSSENMLGESFLELSACEDNAGLPSLDSRPCVEFAIVEPSHGEKASSGEYVRVEAAHIAKRFNELHDAGCKWSDMALLLRSLTDVEEYLSAMRKLSIPCAVTGGRHFYSFPEVSQACNVIRLLLEPERNDLWFRVLASDVFSCSDDELALLKGTFNAAGGDGAGVRVGELDPMGGGIPERIASARKLILEAREKLLRESLADVLLEVFEASGWMSALAGDPLSRSGKVANVLKVCDVAAGFQGRSLDWMLAARKMVVAADAAEGGRVARDRSEPPGRLGTSGGDGSVSIMTVHASKGLEYDIVAVAGMTMPSTPNARMLSNCLMRGSSGRVQRVAIDLSGITSLSGPFSSICPSREEAVGMTAKPGSYPEYVRGVWSAENEEEKDEIKRLAYVAATRAGRKLLWLSRGKWGKDGELVVDKLTGFMLESAFGSQSVSEELSGSVLTSSGTRVLVERLMTSMPKPDLLESWNRKRAVIADLPESHSPIGNLPQERILSYSGSWNTQRLSASARDILGCGEKLQAGEDVGAGSRSLGNAFHNCVWRRVLLGRALTESEVAEEAAREDGVLFEELSRILAVMEESGLVSASTNKVMMPEMPFMFELPCGRIVSGSIDLAVSSHDGMWELYDWKTGFPDDVLAEYGYQAILYSAGLLSSGLADKVKFSFVEIQRECRLSSSPIWTEEDLPEMLRILEEAIGS